MDTILYNGNFYTLDRAYKTAEAMAIKDGIIIRIGANKEILPLAEKNTKVINLKQKLVLPGFMDTHLHILAYSMMKSRVNVNGTKTFKEAAAICRKTVEKARANSSWVMGNGFNQDDWSDMRRMPTRQDLDIIAEDIPVVMGRVCGHIVCLNTKALKITGLWNEKKGETKEKLDFGEDGRPNGYVRETTAMAVQKFIGKLNFNDIKTLLEKGCKDAAAKGITQIHSDDFNLFSDNDFEDVIKAYKELCQEGRLPIRVVEQNRFRTYEQLKTFLSLGYRLNDSFGNFKFGPMKIIGDGSLGSHSAAMRLPYKNDPNKRGILIQTDEELYQYVKLAYEHNFPVVVHCIGDASLEQTCDTIERLSREFPAIDRRNGIIHCQIMDKALQDRFKELSLIAYVQPVFIRTDAKVTDDCVGFEMGKQSYNWRRFKDLGIHMCGGSDCPVESFDVLRNIFYAVTRKPSIDAEPWYPENGISLEEAIETFTKEAAYASYDENRLGTLSIGKYADLTVLDRNIFENKIEDLFTTEVEMTMVGGKIVYSKRGLA